MVYTPPGLARFMVRGALTAWLGARPEAMRRRAAAAALRRLCGIRLCDPACGAGAFLLAAEHEIPRLAARLARVADEPVPPLTPTLHGMDIDPDAVDQARRVLGDAACVLQGDSLTTKWDSQRFDLVIANPPYVRHERLDADTKHTLQLRFQARLGTASDLAAYFYLLGVELLKPGGIHAFIGTDSWLDVAYGAPLRRALGQELRLLSLQRFDATAFEALIHTVFSLARRQPPGRWGATALVRLGGMPPACRVVERTFVRQEDLTRRAKWSGGPWRGGSPYAALLAAAGERLTTLGALAGLRRGWSTGANAFFHVEPLEITGDEARVRCADGSEHLLPVAALGPPVIVKAGELLVPRLAADATRHRLVSISRELASHPLAAAYLAWGEAQGFAARRSVRDRHCWHEAQPGLPAPLLVPIAHKRRPVLAWGRELWGSDNFVALRPKDPADEGLLAALLLSTFALLAYESLGRANFGQGLLKTQVYELAQLPVPVPAAISAQHRAALIEAAEAVARRPSEILYNDVRGTDRRALDEALLAALGVDLAVEELHEAACAAVWERQSRGAGREARVGWAEWRASSEAF